MVSLKGCQSEALINPFFKLFSNDTAENGVLKNMGSQYLHHVSLVIFRAHYLVRLYRNCEGSRIPGMRYISNCIGALFGSVPLKAEFKKCAAYFLKEANRAPEQLRSPAGCGGESNGLKKPN